MFAENKPAARRNDAVLNDLPGELHLTDANDNILGNCKCTLATIQATQNEKQTNTGDLAKFIS